MFYVSDTHAWVFYLLDKLPKKANDVFLSVGQSFYVCSNNCSCRVLHLIEGGKISLDYKQLLNKFEVSANFIPVSLNFDIIRQLPEIKLTELHDRIIVATAKILNAKLISRDEEIVRSGLIETIWK